MLDTIRTEADYTTEFTGRNKINKRVMQAMHDVDRKHFVPEVFQNRAYDNGPLPIGHGQTISQPYIVALMTDLLDTSPHSVVLEVGTGSGYQAAILSRLVKKVYSIEKIPDLAEQARTNLKNLGYDNIEILCNNGYYGWEEKAPFDSIIVTAAATHIPNSLINQLKPGGRMVIPVEYSDGRQKLILVTKDLKGNTSIEPIISVVFVPLVPDGFKDESEITNTL